MKELLARAREIWGDTRMTPDEIGIAMGVVHGDICRAIRDDNREAIEVEIGNMLLSTVRWADDMRLDIDKCIRLAEGCQERYVRRKWGTG